MQWFPKCACHRWERLSRSFQSRYWPNMQVDSEGETEADHGSFLEAFQHSQAMEASKKQWEKLLVPWQECFLTLIIVWILDWSSIFHTQILDLPIGIIHNFIFDNIRYLVPGRLQLWFPFVQQTLLITKPSSPDLNAHPFSAISGLRLSRWGSNLDIRDVYIIGDTCIESLYFQGPLLKTGGLLCSRHIEDLIIMASSTLYR